MRQPVQIALDHHRAGRLRKAEALYREALEENPEDAEAAHWLGVLCVQAGQPEQAVGLLEAAVARVPDDAAYQHNLALAYLLSGRSADAVRCFERAAELSPGRPEISFGLGLAYLRQRRAGGAEAAVRCFKEAGAAGLDSAELHHNLGVALTAAGRFAEAMEASGRAIDLRSDYVEAYEHLAIACQNAGEPAAARRCLVHLLEQKPGHAPAYHGLAVLEAEAGRFDEAAELFRDAIALDPSYAPAYHGLGQVFEETGRHRDALAAFERAAHAIAAKRSTRPARRSLSDSIGDLERKLAPSNVGQNTHFALAVGNKVFPPEKVPAASVVRAFDQYAEFFDDHLRGTLRYRVPELLLEAVAATNPAELLDVLDLGCGTGLCGLMLRPLARSVRGVDLSPKMIDKANEKGVYDRLEVGDLVPAMLSFPRSADLIVAADVFIYVGDLLPVFEAAAAALRPGGLFVFSVEAAEGDRFSLRKTHRFAHSMPYIQRLATMWGFREESLSSIIIRQEQLEPMPGYLFVLRLPEGESAEPKPQVNSAPFQ